MLRVLQSLCNLKGASATLLPSRLSNFKATLAFQHLISHIRVFVRCYDKTGYWNDILGYVVLQGYYCRSNLANDIAAFKCKLCCHCLNLFVTASRRMMRYVVVIREMKLHEKSLGELAKLRQIPIPLCRPITIIPPLELRNELIMTSRPFGHIITSTVTSFIIHAWCWKYYEQPFKFRILFLLRN